MRIFVSSGWYGKYSPIGWTELTPLTIKWGILCLGLNIDKYILTLKRNMSYLMNPLQLWSPLRIKIMLPRTLSIKININNVPIETSIILYTFGKIFGKLLSTSLATPIIVALDRFINSKPRRLKNLQDWDL